MMREIRLALVPALFALTGIAWADQPAPAPLAKEDALKFRVEMCDRLAAFESDADRPPSIPPVALGKVDGAAATKACTGALADEKDPVVKRRMHLLRARGLLAEKKTSEAIAEFRVADEAGSVAAAVFLGKEYLKGELVQKDAATARLFLEKGAVKGSPEAMTGWAGLSMVGQDVAPNSALGREWLLKAAALDYGVAMAFLAGVYLDGMGVPKDVAAGMAWLKKAEATGDPVAIVGLANIYLEGVGVPPDKAAALRYFEKAASLGSSYAMTRAGDLYRQGQGVPLDLKRAHDWYQKAFDAGETKVADKLKETSEAATPSPR